MEINVNSKSFGMGGIGREAFDANAVGAGTGATGADAAREARDAVRFSRVQTVGLDSSEPVAEVPDTALLRDDALGKLVSAAFNLPSPPLPAFVE